MKNALTATLLILVGAAASFAHHSIAAEFDDKKPVSIKGAVVRYEWMKDRKSTRLNSSHT